MTVSPSIGLWRAVRSLLTASALTVWVASASAASSDTLAQRMAPCMSCHTGAAADTQSGFVPRLDGKPAGYLFNQLVNYREGRRENKAMAHLVRNLSDTYLWEMAQFFADRDAKQRSRKPPATETADMAHGRTLVRDGVPARDIPACQACHGQRLTGVRPNTPALIGLPRHYIMAQIGAWQTDTRAAAAPDCMHEIAGRLTSRDVQAVSSWLAAQPVPAQMTPRERPIAEPPMRCGSVERPGR